MVKMLLVLVGLAIAGKAIEVAGKLIWFVVVPVVGLLLLGASLQGSW